ncbi:MAG: hypothetical protein OHK0013_01640 [Sandaracinaceae bacterium]
MIAEGKRKELLAIAEKLAEQLAAFKTPNTGEPVDPSRLADVFRFVKANGIEDLPTFLKVMPGSYLRHASRSAAPQLEEVQRRVTTILQPKKSAEELAFVLGWARRLLSVKEKTGHGPRGVQAPPGAPRG